MRERDYLARGLLHRDHGAGERQALQRPVADALVHQVHQAGGADFFAAAAAQVRPHHRRHREIQRHLLDFSYTHPAGIEAADQRTYRRAYHQVGPQTYFVQRLEHAHMGKPARPAGAQHPGCLQRAVNRARRGCIGSVIVWVLHPGASAQTGQRRGQERPQYPAPVHGVAIRSVLERRRTTRHKGPSFQGSCGQAG